MSFARTLVAALSLSVGSPLCAQPTPPQYHGTNTARDGQLVLVGLFAYDSNKFQEEWRQATPPNLHTTNTTVRNRPVSLMIVFGGCLGNEFGLCNVVADVTITDPSGRKYTDYKDVAIFSQTAGDGLTLASGSLKITIENGELLGRYRVDLALIDRVAQKTLRVFDFLTVNEAMK